jgi:hypothetical protein
VDDTQYADEGSDKENENTQEGDVKPFSKKARTLAMFSTPGEISSLPLGFHKKQPWMPDYALAMWEDDKLRKMVTVCVSFDGGVNLTKDVSYEISDDGLKLEIKVKAINRLNDVDTLHEHHRMKYKDSLPKYHPKIIAFQKFFKAIKVHEEDNRYNEAVILLPFPVHSIVDDELFLKDQYSSLTLYLDLVGIEADTFSAKPKVRTDIMTVPPPPAI